MVILLLYPPNVVRKPLFESIRMDGSLAIRIRTRENHESFLERDRLYVRQVPLV